jgi:proton-translocating NADH-quinone oxidoreductase chain M
MFSEIISDHLFSMWTASNFVLMLIIVIPVLSSIYIYIVSTEKPSTIYNKALFSSLISFLLSLILWSSMEEVKGGFQSTYTLDFIPTYSLSLKLGVDGISIFFVILTNLFIYLCIFSLDLTTPKLAEALFHLFLLQWSVLLSFLTLDILGFFVFFEITLIPIYFLVLIWGSRERRVRASYLISIYTLFGSIFIFFNLIYLYSKTGTMNYELLLNVKFTEFDQKYLWITFFLAFAAKIPVFPMHIWLPEAHVEAPTLGSVILAVLLLKLGTYGLVRFSLPLFSVGTVYFSSVVSTFAILGIIYTCLTAIRQIDLKKIIAYSSVGHMNVVLLGIISENIDALQGAIFQMLSHGIVSGALFFCVGVLYSRYVVRSLEYYGGLAILHPMFAIVFLVFSLANISFPLTSSFVGEFLILMGFLQNNFWATFFACTSMVFGAVYTLWTYNRIFFGNVRSSFLNDFKDLNEKEVFMFGALIFILFLMGLAPYLILDTTFVDSLNVLEHAKGNRSLI